MLLSNLLSFAAPTFAVMLLSRVLIGVALGGFWSIAASLAPWLVHPSAVGPATAVILSGVSIGTLIAVPAGTFINLTESLVGRVELIGRRPGGQVGADRYSLEGSW